MVKERIVDRMCVRISPGDFRDSDPKRGRKTTRLSSVPIIEPGYHHFTAIRLKATILPLPVTLPENLPLLSNSFRLCNFSYS